MNIRPQPSMPLIGADCSEWDEDTFAACAAAIAINPRDIDDYRWVFKRLFVLHERTIRNRIAREITK
jgi:hypothetical protein